MADKAKPPEGAKLVTKHKNGTVETEILFRKNKNHPIDPNGIAYHATFEYPQDNK